MTENRGYSLHFLTVSPDEAIEAGMLDFSA
jgi:hypothetical protein